MILALVLAAHWVTVKDSNAVHKRYLTPVGNVIGEYYLPRKSTYPATTGEWPYVAQCGYESPRTFKAEQEAKRFIEACTYNPDF